MTPAEREIREKLRSPVTVSFQQRPLQQAIDTLMDMVGIAAFIDPAGLAAEGLPRMFQSLWIFARKRFRSRAPSI